MAKRSREDARWWLAASIDDYESAQLLFKGGKYSKTIHVLHNATEKALKRQFWPSERGLPMGPVDITSFGCTRWFSRSSNYPRNLSER